MKKKKQNAFRAKHKGKSIELIVLKDAKYAHELTYMGLLDGTEFPAGIEAERLIDIFDSIPIVKKCMGDGCSNLATHCWVHHENIGSQFWCCDDEKCRPDLEEEIGITPYLRIKHYIMAAQVGERYCRNNKYNSLVQALAEAKGLPRRVGEKHAHEFFGSTYERKITIQAEDNDEIADDIFSL